MDDPNEEFMKVAIEEARRGMEDGDGGPFGAAIVCDGEVVASAHNTVFFHSDPTAHAEVNAVRKAARQRGLDLSDCEIYSTSEPCPMCFSAIHWARLPRVVYGSPIADLVKAGFNEIELDNYTIRWWSNLQIDIVKEFMLEECRKLLEEYEETELPTY